MEIGKQIKKYRSEMEVSQEELAERIFVSRQTVSNWENDKNYPDLKSLLLLSSLFGVSLDILIKGDIEQMKEEMKTEDIKYVQHSYRIHDIIFFSSMLLSPPLLVLPVLGFGTIITFYIAYGIVFLLSVAFIFSIYRIRKIGKKFDIKSYKEIVAFYEGKPLSKIDKQRAREEPYPYKYKKRIYAITALYLVLILGSVGFVYFKIFGLI
jgi:transcriptional regulator with XRE-family HTH domain